MSSKTMPDQATSVPQKSEQDDFEAMKHLARGEMLSALAGKATVARVIVCAKCFDLHPIVPYEVEMTRLHWREWAVREGWRQRGRGHRWMCPLCQVK